jgi:hypothetical protein
MNSDAPRPEKVLSQTADENDTGSRRSFYQFLLRKCGSQHGTSATAGKARMAASYKSRHETD